MLKSCGILISIDTYNSTINSFKPKNITTWTFDFRATDDISYSLNNFFSYKKINHLNVNLLDRTKVTVTRMELVKLNKSLLFKDALSIPFITYNLISIFKLVSSLNIEIFFNLVFV